MVGVGRVWSVSRFCNSWIDGVWGTQDSMPSVLPALDLCVGPDRDEEGE